MEDALYNGLAIVIGWVLGIIAAEIVNGYWRGRQK